MYHSESIIVWDTETTGLISNAAIPLKDQPRIVELFALKLIRTEDDIIEGDTWHSLFKVKKIEEDAIKVHGITLEMLAGAPDFALRFDNLCEFFLGTRVMVGQNLSFDRDMLFYEAKRLNAVCAFPWPPVHIDLVEATEGEEGYRLGLTKLHEKLFGEAFAEAHRAEADVRATARCFRELVKRGTIRL